jgi:hypothetical protein
MQGNGFLSAPAVILLIAAAVAVAALAAARIPRYKKIYPYKKAKLFTETEREFFGVLRECVGEGLLIFSKVRLADVIRPTTSEIIYLNHVCQKHVDFVVSDTEGEPLLVIELDDYSHNRPDRIKRDEFVDNALDAAGVEILHVPVSDCYNMRALAKLIRRFT